MLNRLLKSIESLPCWRFRAGEPWAAMAVLASHCLMEPGASGTGLLEEGLLTALASIEAAWGKTTGGYFMGTSHSSRWSTPTPHEGESNKHRGESNKQQQGLRERAPLRMKRQSTIARLPLLVSFHWSPLQVCPGAQRLAGVMGRPPLTHF